MSVAKTAQPTIRGLGRMGTSHADAISDLDHAFKDSYRLAATQTLGTLRASVPVRVNRFEQIALYRPGVEQPELFSMDTGPYLQASAVSHTAAALDARMVSGGLGKLDADRLAWLDLYQSLLSAAEGEIAARRDMSDALRTLQVGMLAEVRRFAQRIHQQGSVEQAVLDVMGATVLTPDGGLTTIFLVTVEDQAAVLVVSIQADPFD